MTAGVGNWMTLIMQIVGNSLTADTICASRPSCGAADRAELMRGRLAGVQPSAYRQQLHAALTQVGRTTGRICGHHLTVLLDAARKELGAPGSGAAQRLYDVIQEIRTVLMRISENGSGRSSVKDLGAA
ncbi:hypothetical protein [Streptomyces sp. NPDC001450]